MQKSIKRILFTGGLLVVLLVVGAVVLIPTLRYDDRGVQRSYCINNLRQIDGAKQQWALENHKTTNDMPIWEDVRPYFKNGIACPQGGTYILGRVDEPPRCSISG